MLTLVFVVTIFAVFIAGLYLIELFVLQPKRLKEAEAAPRITLTEVQSFWDNIEQSSLPIAKATVQKRPPNSPQESRIGGAPLAIGDEPNWPKRPDDGFPLAFVAQINFADFPPLEGFPSKGILQIFSSFEWIDDVKGCDRIIRWDPDPVSDRLLTIPDEIQQTTRRVSEFSEKARRVGLPLTFELGVAPGNPDNWPFEAKNPWMENRLPENEDVAAILDDWGDRTDRILAGYGIHWVGGHPTFIQADPRIENPECRHLDRVVFHLGYDDDIKLGDSGVLNVMISRDALAKRDFQSAYLTWDCS